MADVREWGAVRTVKRTVAGIGWLIVAGLLAWAMLMWSVIWLHGVGERSADFTYECGTEVGEPHGAPDSVVRQMLFWDCYDPSGGLVYRSWLPLVGWVLAVVPPGLFVGVVLFVSRWRRSSTLGSTPGGTARALMSTAAIGVAFVAMFIAAFLAVGTRDSFFGEALTWLLAIGGWVGWGRILRRTFGPLAPPSNSVFDLASTTRQ